MSVELKIVEFIGKAEEHIKNQEKINEKQIEINENILIKIDKQDDKIINNNFKIIKVLAYIGGVGGAMSALIVILGLVLKFIKF